MRQRRAGRQSDKSDAAEHEALTRQRDPAAAFRRSHSCRWLRRSHARRFNRSIDRRPVKRRARETSPVTDQMAAFERLWRSLASGKITQHASCSRIHTFTQRTCALYNRQIVTLNRRAMHGHTSRRKLMGCGRDKEHYLSVIRGRPY